MIIGSISSAYIKGRQFAPQGDGWHKAVNDWSTLYSDADAAFDKELHIKAEDIEPMITYGTNPGMGIGITGHVPALGEIDEREKPSFEKSLLYMGVNSRRKH